MIDTKQRILNAALQLFNRDGLMNVRLQHIADEALMSIGNLTYHYRTKELIVNALWNIVQKQQEELLANFRVAPLFEDVERQIRHTFQLQQNYLFFYVDTLEIMRAFPDIREAHRQHRQWQVKQIEIMIDFNIARGVFQSEPQPGLYEQIARQYWLTSHSWWYYCRVVGDDILDFAAYRRAMWSIWQSIFTPRGWLEFQQMEAMIIENLI